MTSIAIVDGVIGPGTRPTPSLLGIEGGGSITQGYLRLFANSSMLNANSLPALICL